MDKGLIDSIFNDLRKIKKAKQTIEFLDLPDKVKKQLLYLMEMEMESDIIQIAKNIGWDALESFIQVNKDKL